MQNSIWAYEPDPTQRHEATVEEQREWHEKRSRKVVAVQVRERSAGRVVNRKSLNSGWVK
jgi:hypothetical protein